MYKANYLIVNYNIERNDIITSDRLMLFFSLFLVAKRIPEVKRKQEERGGGGGGIIIIKKINIFFFFKNLLNKKKKIIKKY